jgi:hypothetical protein
VLVRPTGFYDEASVSHFAKCETGNPRQEFQKLYDALWRDEKRNAMICGDVLSAIREGRSPLVLTERTEHLELLAERLSRQGVHVSPCVNVRMFANMFDRRCRGYESLGCVVLLPASALPGWPVEVPLSIEPEWKTELRRQRAAADSRTVMERDCAESQSQQRCIPDGVRNPGAVAIRTLLRLRHSRAPVSIRAARGNLLFNFHAQNE